MADSKVSVSPDASSDLDTGSPRMRNPEAVDKYDGNYTFTIKSGDMATIKKILSSGFTTDNMPELDDNGDNTITLSAKNRQTIETANQLLVDGGVIGSDYNKNYNFHVGKENISNLINLLDDSVKSGKIKANSIVITSDPDTNDGVASSADKDQLAKFKEIAQSAGYPQITETDYGYNYYYHIKLENGAIIGDDTTDPNVDINVIKGSFNSPQHPAKDNPYQQVPYVRGYYPNAPVNWIQAHATKHIHMQPIYHLMDDETLQEIGTAKTNGYTDYALAPLGNGIPAWYFLTTSDTPDDTYGKLVYRGTGGHAQFYVQLPHIKDYVPWYGRYDYVTNDGYNHVKGQNNSFLVDAGDINAVTANGGNGHPDVYVFYHHVFNTYRTPAGRDLTIHVGDKLPNYSDFLTGKDTDGKNIDNFLSIINKNIPAHGSVIVSSSSGLPKDSSKEGNYAISIVYKWADGSQSDPVKQILHILPKDTSQDETVKANVTIRYVDDSDSGKQVGQDQHINGITIAKDKTVDYAAKPNVPQAPAGSNWTYELVKSQGDDEDGTKHVTLSKNNLNQTITFHLRHKNNASDVKPWDATVYVHYLDVNDNNNEIGQQVFSKEDIDGNTGNYKFDISKLTLPDNTKFIRSDGNMLPGSVTVDQKTGAKNINVYVGHNTTEVPQTEEVRRIIIVHNPKTGDQTITQKGTLSRTQTVDMFTGDSDDKPWNAVTLDSFTAPTVDGYTADTPYINAITITKPQDVIVVEINYSKSGNNTTDDPNRSGNGDSHSGQDSTDPTDNTGNHDQNTKANQHVVYKTDNGTIVDSQDVSGSINETVSFIPKKLNGYKIKDGQNIPSSFTLKNQNPDFVIFVNNDDSTPKDDNDMVNQLVQYKTNDGHIVRTDVFTGETGSTTNLVVNVPKGYTIRPDQTIPSTITFKVGQNPIVIYVNQPDSNKTVDQKIEYQDPDGNIIRTDTLTGNNGSNIEFVPSVPAGYKIKPGYDAPTNITFKDGNGPIIIPVVKDDGNSGDNQPDSNKTVDQKIEYQDPDGNIIKTDTLTGKNGDSTKFTPSVPTGYKIKPGYDVPTNITFKDGNGPIIIPVVKDDGNGGNSGDDKNKTVDQKIEYQDPDGNIIRTDTLTGKDGDSTKFTPSVPTGYKIKPGYDVPTNITFKDGNGPIIIPVVKDDGNGGNSGDDKNKTVDQKIEYQDPDGNIIRTDTLTGKDGDSTKFTPSVPTGYKIKPGYDVPTNITFKDGNGPIIIPVVKDDGNGGNSDDGQKKTVDQKIEYQDPDGNIIRTDTLTGKDGDSTKFTPSVPAGYKIKPGYDVPTNITFKDGNGPIIIPIVKDDGNGDNSDNGQNKTVNQKIEYQDPDGNIIRTDTLTGKDGDSTKFTPSVPAGYKIKPGYDVPTNITFKDGNGPIIIPIVKDDGNDGSNTNGNGGSNTNGNGGSNINGNGGSNTNGNGGSNTNGNGGSNINGNGGSNTNGNGGSNTNGNGGSNINGNGGSNTNGNGGSNTNGNGGSNTNGNGGSSTNGNGGSNTNGNDGSNTNGNGGSNTNGNGGSNTNGNGRSNTNGNDGSNTNGNDGSNTNGNDGSNTNGNGGSNTNGNDGSNTNGKTLPQTGSSSSYMLALMGLAVSSLGLGLAELERRKKRI